MPRLALIASFLGLCVVAAAPSVAAPRDRVLSRTLPEMKFTGVTFGDAIDFIRDASGANIHVNWKALEAQNVTPDTTVNLRLRAVTLRKVLNLLLSEVSGSDTLTYFVDEGVVEITTREMADKKVYTRVYPVEDLVMDIPEFTEAPTFDLSQVGQQNGSGGGGGGGGGGGSGQSIFGNTNTQQQRDVGKTRDERGEELVTLITETVRPEIWAINGGTATIRYFRGSLVVTAPRSVHEALGG
jgi:hypothetical protein